MKQACLPRRRTSHPQCFVPFIAFVICSATSLAFAGTLTVPVQETIEDFKRTDSSLASHFENAKGYAVFPEITKGGLVFGGANGRGHVFAGGQLIGGVELTQVTFGAQIGGQVYSQVIFFENDRALEDFKASKLKLSAQVSAIAAAEGVAEHAKYHDGVAIFTLPRQGLMGEASVGGQKFTFKPLTP